MKCTSTVQGAVAHYDLPPPPNNRVATIDATTRCTERRSPARNTIHVTVHYVLVLARTRPPLPLR
jgi:hypothetical protein